MEDQASDASPVLLLSHKNPGILIWESNMNTEVQIWHVTLHPVFLKLQLALKGARV